MVSDITVFFIKVEIFCINTTDACIKTKFSTLGIYLYFIYFLLLLLTKNKINIIYGL
jgi:hypothetical protein